MLENWVDFRSHRPVPCKASDECHGPSSPAPPPPSIHVNTGTSGNEARGQCLKGRIPKHGKCHRFPERKAPPSACVPSSPQGWEMITWRPDFSGGDAPAIRIVGCMAAVVLLGAAFASPAQATEAIESFKTTASTSQAGGHPDLETNFSLQSPGAPEAARNVIFNAPRDCSATLTRSPSAGRLPSRSMNAHRRPRRA